MATKKRKYEAKVRCAVDKLVTGEAESEEEFEENLWDCAEDEYEIGQIDWEIKSVKELE